MLVAFLSDRYTGGKPEMTKQEAHAFSRCEYYKVVSHINYNITHEGKKQ